VKASRKIKIKTREADQIKHCQGSIERNRNDAHSLVNQLRIFSNTSFTFATSLQEEVLIIEIKTAELLLERIAETIIGTTTAKYI